jgi:uncharacterized protein HemY
MFCQDAGIFLTMLRNLLSPRPQKVANDSRIPERPEKPLLAPGLLLSHGLQALKRKDWTEAEHYLKKYLQEAPSHAQVALYDQAKHSLIEIYVNTFRLDEALDLAQA